MPRPMALLLYLLVLFCAAGLSAQSHGSRTIDPAQSTITIHVFRTGFFSAFGHDHEIRAPISHGTFNEGDTPSVELTVESRKLTVEDKDASPKDKAQIQSDMLGPKVLDTERYSHITFRSTNIESAAAGRWRVRGDLSLHGQTQPVTLDVAGSEGRYRGSTTLRQKDFGITPISVAGGTVKVKNEIKIEFQIVGE